MKSIIKNMYYAATFKIERKTTTSKLYVKSQITNGIFFKLQDSSPYSKPFSYLLIVHLFSSSLALTKTYKQKGDIHRTSLFLQYYSM